MMTRNSMCAIRWRGVFRVALAVAAMLASSGCVSQMVAKRIVKAPNRQGVPRLLRDPKTLDATDAYFAHKWRLPIASPVAELSVGVLDPGMVTFKYSLEEKPMPDGKGATLAYSFDWKKAESPPERPEIKATLVLLHGIMMTKETLLPWAFYFAQEGYRVVLVDLRGHGRSTGEWIGFGAWEAGDLVALTDALERRGLIVGRLGVFGISYGAVMGIHWAARDPRVAALVAVAPFSDPQKAIVDFARGVMPKLAAKLSDATFALAEEKAAAMAGFRWSDVSVLEATKRLNVPVLFFHGKHDAWIPPQHSAELMRVAKRGSRRGISDDDHMTIALRLEPLGAEAAKWFREKLGSGTPTPVPVPAPVAQQ